jgi:lipopolysaccharide transport system ATP-binding protein
MSDAIITVESLSKAYRTGLQEPIPKTLTGVMTSWLKAPLHNFQRLRELDISRTMQRDGNGRPKDIIWALKDVSFEVKEGEVVGIIGRNGAGKSTLLKILSRITEPSFGRALIRGRISSLLEVGTGFHHELTGRDNIYMNGTILGMTRREIDRRFEEIVAFSGIEQFLDTPIKRYSSGMQVRLAFAIAAHLEPEILIIDEVLAVGDAEFQSKCLRKMEDVASGGRTVLFVSHNMAAIESLCGRCLLIVDGRVSADGGVKSVAAQYLYAAAGTEEGQQELGNHARRTKGSVPVMTNVMLGSGAGTPTGSVRMGEDLCIHVEFCSQMQAIRPVLGVVVKHQLGFALFGVNNRFIPGYRFTDLVTKGVITCTLERIPLMPGRYLLDLYLGDEHQDHDVIHDAIGFEVLQADIFGSGKLPPGSAGPIFHHAKWCLRVGEPYVSVNT